MKLTLRDLSKLAASLLALAAMLVLGIAAVLVSRDRLQTARIHRADAQGERREFDGKLRQVRSEENEIRQKAAVFERLSARGAIGEERRLEWIELLGEIRERRRLIEIRYEFAPRRALDGEGAERFGLHASAMSLQARLLHEEDLVLLLGDLARLAPALIQARRCDVSRLPPANANDALRDGLLQADCLIDWITLHERPEGAK